MLERLVVSVEAEGRPGLSLSVHRENHALALDERMSFRQVVAVGDSWTRLLRLPGRGWASTLG
jgi:hypothetical protein